MPRQVSVREMVQNLQIALEESGSMYSDPRIYLTNSGGQLQVSFKENENSRPFILTQWENERQMFRQIKTLIAAYKCIDRDDDDFTSETQQEGVLSIR